MRTNGQDAFGEVIWCGTRIRHFLHLPSTYKLDLTMRPVASMFNFAHFNEILKTKVVYAPYMSVYVYELKKINAKQLC